MNNITYLQVKPDTWPIQPISTFFLINISLKSTKELIINKSNIEIKFYSLYIHILGVYYIATVCLHFEISRLIG